MNTSFPDGLSSGESSLSTQPVATRIDVQTPIAEGPSRRLVFGLVGVALFMGTVNTSIVATALPAIHQSLHATINWAGWTITIYGLGLVVAFPVGGKISDQFGRRRVFLCSIAIFTVSSLLCGFANDIYMLIGLRALQALGGGALQPTAAGILSDHFGSDRDRALGMIGPVSAFGQLVGPVIGGLFVGYLSWRWSFFVNVPIGIGLFFAVAKYIPESRLSVRSAFDIRGLVFMALFILAAILGITDLGSGHTSLHSPTFVAPELIALGFGYVFVRHTKRAPDPFIALRLLRSKSFAVMNVENFLFGVIGFGVASLVPLYAQDRYHFSALNAGTLLTTRAIGIIAIGAIATFALRRTGYRLPMMAGCTVVAVGILLMSIAPRWGLSPYAWLAISAGVTGFGTGMVTPAASNATLQLAPEDVGAIVGLRNMFTYIGIIFSVSIITAILSRSTSPGIAQAHCYWVLAAIAFVVMIPLFFWVPEHKGSW